jgi:hypothetical protein
MRITLSENFRAVFYAPFYATVALGFAQREGVDVARAAACEDCVADVTGSEPANPSSAC